MHKKCKILEGPVAFFGFVRLFPEVFSYLTKAFSEHERISFKTPWTYFIFFWAISGTPTLDVAVLSTSWSIVRNWDWIVHFYNLRQTLLGPPWPSKLWPNFWCYIRSKLRFTKESRCSIILRDIRTFDVIAELYCVLLRRRPMFELLR